MVNWQNGPKSLPTPSGTTNGKACCRSRSGPEASTAATGQPTWTGCCSSAAQRLGLPLAEIRDLLAVRDTGACPCEAAEGLLRRHVAEIDQEIARLAALRDELACMLAAMPGPDCPDPLPGTWCPPGLSQPGRK